MATLFIFFFLYVGWVKAVRKSNKKVRMGESAVVC